MNKINIILYAIIMICFYDICDAKFENYMTIENIKFSINGSNETNFKIGKIRFFNNSMFCNFPRTNNRLYATFTKINFDKKDVYEPYPNSILNEFNGSCERLISVISFEIVDKDDLYILDEGRYYNRTICPPKLVIYNNKKEIQRYNLTNPIINNASIQLEDILIDRINNYIYISYHDTSNVSGIFLMHIDTNKIIKSLLYNNERLKEESGYTLHIKGADPLPKEISQIKSMGLSCDGEAFFFSFISSKMIYSILTKEIYMQYKNETNNNDIYVDKIYEAYKNDATSTIIYSNMGNLFLTGLEKNKIYSYDLIDNDLSRFDYKGLRELDTNGENILFPIKMTFYEGKIYLLTNQINSKPSKYTIYFETINEKSYIYGCAGLKYQFNLSFYIMLGIFILILLFVLTFVIVGNIQDKYINKKNN